MDAVTRLDEVLTQPLSPEDEAALAESMSRHPAGKRQLHTCPTCGQNASGALGDPSLAVAL